MIKLISKNLMKKSTGPDEFVLTRKDGTNRIVEISTRLITFGKKKIVLGMAQDITDQKMVKKERERLIHELRSALSEIIKLSGLLPICMHCKNIAILMGNGMYWKITSKLIVKQTSPTASVRIAMRGFSQILPESVKGMPTPPLPGIRPAGLYFYSFILIVVLFVLPW